jgi:hypothetical protein
METTETLSAEERLAVAEAILRECAARAREARQQHPGIAALDYCAGAYDQYNSDCAYQASQREQQEEIYDE